jgi:hypothetical protein
MNNSSPINNLPNKNKYTTTDPTKFAALLGQTSNGDIQTIYKRVYNINKNLNSEQLTSIKFPRSTKSEQIRREKAGTFWKYLLHRIRLTVGYQENVNNTNSNNKSNRVTRSKTEDYLPWVLTKVDPDPPGNIRNIEVVKDTVIPSLLGNYTLKYVESAEFPTVLLEPEEKSKLKSSRVGLFCKGLSTTIIRFLVFVAEKNYIKQLETKLQQTFIKKVCKVFRLHTSKNL